VSKRNFRFCIFGFYELTTISSSEINMPNFCECLQLKKKILLEKVVERILSELFVKIYTLYKYE